MSDDTLDQTNNEVADGLKTALGQFEKTVTIADRKSAKAGTLETTKDVTIRKLRARQFVRIFEQVDALVKKGVVSLTDEAGQLVLGNKRVLTEFREESMILRGGQPVLNMIAIACDLDQDHVDNLDLLDLARLFGASWEVNQRFFEENQTEFKQVFGPIWKLVEELKTKKKSSQTESSQDSSTNSSPEAMEPSEK